MTFAALQSAALAVVVLAAVTMAPAFVPCSAELQRFERSPKPDGSLSLLVLGDWGRNGLFNQSEVAFQVNLSFSLLPFLQNFLRPKNIIFSGKKKEAIFFLLLFGFGREQIEHKKPIFGSLVECFFSNYSELSLATV